AFHPNLVYRNAGKAKVFLDLAVPKRGKGPIPAVIVLHGTGPLNKGRAGLTGVGLGLARKGYAALGVGFRCRPEDAYPAGVEDVKAALTWVGTKEAAKYRIDSDRVGVLGFSGGGALGCLLGMKKPVRVRAVVSYFAPSDLAHLHRQARGLPGFIVR